MRHPDLYLLNAEGKEVLRELLAPLFSTLAPGFEARAEELRMEATGLRQPAFEVACCYFKAGTSFPLTVTEGYHPWIVSSRIRILCGMSILPDVPRQDGRMPV